MELTTGDFDILWSLASRQGNVVTRDEILRVVRGIDYDGLDRSIDARICRLRRKLQEAGGAESMIKIVRLRGRDARQRPRDRHRAATPPARDPHVRRQAHVARAGEGVGLGLAIVKSVAEWHGGEAGISDSPLGGARVSISW